jgi:hypothetical protein
MVKIEIPINISLLPALMWLSLLIIQDSTQKLSLQRELTNHPNVKNMLPKQNNDLFPYNAVSLILHFFHQEENYMCVHEFIVSISPLQYKLHEECKTLSCSLFWQQHKEHHLIQSQSSVHVALPLANNVPKWKYKERKRKSGKMTEPGNF